MENEKRISRQIAEIVWLDLMQHVTWKNHRGDGPFNLYVYI